MPCSAMAQKPDGSALEVRPHYVKHISDYLLLIVDSDLILNKSTTQHSYDSLCVSKQSFSQTANQLDDSHWRSTWPWAC